MQILPVRFEWIVGGKLETGGGKKKVTFERSLKNFQKKVKDKYFKKTK